MKFEKYWEKLEQSNPNLKDSTRLTISIPSLKKLLAKAFQAGRSSCNDERKAADDFDKFGKLENPIAGIFDDLFR